MRRLFPDSPLLRRAGEVAVTAFSEGTRVMAEAENYERIAAIWDRYPLLSETRETLPHGTRLLVANGLWRAERPDEALELLTPLLSAEMYGEASLGAMNLAVSIHLDNQSWTGIEAVSGVVHGWKLPSEQRRQFDYSLALALENLGKTDRSRPLWEKLSADMGLNPEQRAYAFFYMARSAQQNQDLRNEYIYAQEALALFLTTGEDTAKMKDCLLMLTDVARRAMRLDQALHWAMEYDKLVGPEDADWAASRYRLAEIHHSLGNDAKWREMLGEITVQSPDTLFGRMAASTLESLRLENQVGRYSN